MPPRRNHSAARWLPLGPGKLLDSGSRGELSIGVGDEVIFGKYGGSDVEVDGDEVLKILRESDILAKVARRLSAHCRRTFDCRIAQHSLRNPQLWQNN